jgi:hypothetical protein
VVGQPSAAPAPAVNALDALDEATPATKKGKSSVPTVILSKADQVQALAQAAESIRLKVEQKALEDLSKGILGPIATANQTEISRQSREYVKSIRFKGEIVDPTPPIGQEVVAEIISILEQGHTAEALALLKEACKPGRREVTAVVGCPTQFCKIDAKAAAEKVAGLKAVFGELYDRYFSIVRTVEITSEALSEAFTADLVALLSKHGYKNGEQYAIERVIKVSGLDEAAVMNPDVGAKLAEAVKAGHIKPFSPSLKEK